MSHGSRSGKPHQPSLYWFVAGAMTLCQLPEEEWEPFICWLEGDTEAAAEYVRYPIGMVEKWKNLKNSPDPS